jgi:hypothetical protein
MREDHSEKIHYRVARRVSRIEHDFLGDRFIEELDLKLVDDLRYHMVRGYGRTVAKDYYYERHLDVYIASPELFWEIVEKEAEKLYNMRQSAEMNFLKA